MILLNPDEKNGYEKKYCTNSQTFSLITFHIQVQNYLLRKDMMILNKPKKIATGTPFEFGEHRLHFGEEIVELADSTSLLNNLGCVAQKDA